MKPVSSDLASARESDARVLLERLLSELYDPQRTAAGSVSKKRGVPVYSEDDLTLFSGRFLGESIGPKALLAFRSGKRGLSLRVRRKIYRAVFMWKAGRDVEAVVRRERFAEYAWSSIEFWERYGVARDGRESIVESLEFWSWTHGAVDLDPLSEALRLEIAAGIREPTERPPTAFVEPSGTLGYAKRLEAVRQTLGELPWNLKQYIDGDRLIFVRDGSPNENADRALEAAFVAKLEQTEKRCSEN